MNSVGLIQWVTEPTYPKSGNILDLLFTTEPDHTGKGEIEQPLPDVNFTYWSKMKIITLNHFLLVTIAQSFLNTSSVET